MKKNKVLSFLLCVIFVAQCGILPVQATETEEPEVTESTGTVSSGTSVPEVAYGSASISNGCRTINGQTPLGGNDRILQTSQAAFVYEANTQTVIYSYNPDEQMAVGTLSKIMAGLVAIENCDLEKVITCSTRWNASLPANVRHASIMEGEELSMYDLVACLLIGCANDAALILANTVTPNESAFVEMMNQRAKEIGCTNTRFTDCTGLDTNNQYTTARDMARIVTEAMKNSTFKELFGATGHTLEPNNRRTEEHVVETENHLIYQLYLPQFFDKRVIGGMASYSDAIGAGLACVAEDNGMSLVIVTMGGTRTYEANGWQVKYYGSFEEVLDLLEFSFDGFHISRLLYPGQTLSQFSVLNGESKVVGQSNVAFDTVLPSNVNLKNLNFRYTVSDGGLTAPIAKGDQIATVQVWYRTSCITETEVYAMHDVANETNSGLEIQTGASRSDTDVTDILTFLGVACLVIIIPIGVYLAVNSARRAAARAKRRRRRASRRRSR